MTRWEQRIEEAKGRTLLGFIPCPRFTLDERQLASHWTTCVVGEVRKRYGVRMDRTLGKLGVMFYHTVRWNMVERAAALRETIEQYALESKRREWESKRESMTRAHASR